MTRTVDKNTTVLVLALVVASILLSLLAVEVALRIPAAVTLKHSTPFLPDARYGVRVHPDLPLPGGGRTDASGFNNVSSAGYKGPEILFVGDSFTFGTFHAEQGFPYLTAAALGGGVRARNIGIPAIGPWEYQALVEDLAVPAQPSLVVITLYLGNDLFQADPALRTLMYLGEPKALPPPDRVPRDVDEFYAARFIGLGWRTFQRMVGGCYGQMKSASDDRLRQTYQQELAVLRSSRLDWYVAQLADRAEYMRKTLAEAGIRSLFLLVPSAIQLNSRLREEVVDCLAWADRSRAYPAVNIQLSRALTIGNIRHLDLTPALQSNVDGHRLFNVDDIHFSIEGNYLVATVLADYIRRHMATPLGLDGARETQASSMGRVTKTTSHESAEPRMQNGFRHTSVGSRPYRREVPAAAEL